MATILVIGASGQIGKQATGKLLEAGHKVIAPVRSPEKLEDIQSDNLTVKKQNLEEDFSAHFNGVDSVVETRAQTKRCLSIFGQHVMPLITQKTPI